MSAVARVAITGVGPISSGGNGKAAVWGAVLGRSTGLVKKSYELDGEKIGSYYLHEAADPEIDRCGIDRQLLNEIRSWKEGDEIADLYHFLAVIKAAIDDSAAGAGRLSGDDVGLVLAHENMGLDHFYWKAVNEIGGAPNRDKKSYFDRFYQKFKRTGYELQTFMSLYHVAKAFDIHGYSLFLNNACASGLYVIEAAADIIRSGKCRAVVASAVDRASVFKQMWFDDAGMLARDGLIKPFARGRDGFTIGSGGAAIVLERLDDALERKAHIYAEYAGGGFALEGWKVTCPDVSGDRYEKVIRRALKESGSTPGSIHMIVPHAIGTVVTDEYEARAIGKVFGQRSDMPFITALKPYIGHTLGSSAMLESAILLMAMDGDTVPATLNCGDRDDKIGLNVVDETRPRAGIKTALKTACGFAGFDGACVFRKV
jgi:3-oxoacyl-(acyl-carrier-protein) synthase